MSFCFLLKSNVFRDGNAIYAKIVPIWHKSADLYKFVILTKILSADFKTNKLTIGINSVGKKRMCQKSGLLGS